MNNADLMMREAERQSLAERVDEYLKSKPITELASYSVRRPLRAVTFNNQSVANNKKISSAAKFQEEVENAVKELAFIEIEGVTIQRGSREIAKIMRQRGYSLQSTSVERTAMSLGIYLKQ